MPAASPAHRPAACLSWAFAALLAAAATFFYAGDLGRWNDDYFFLRQFDRSAPPGHPDAPMRVESWTLDAHLHFWRPLYRYAFTPILITLYQHPAILHLLSASIHIGVCIALFLFLRRLGTGPTSAAIAALAFLVYPAHFEGPFWPTCAPTPFCTALMLAALLVQSHWTRSIRPPITTPHSRLALLALLPALITFTVCCLNEQPAFLIAAMPLMSLPGLSRKGKPLASDSTPPRRRPLLLAFPFLLSAAALITYTLITRTKYPAHSGPNTGDSIPLADLPHHIREFTHQLFTRHSLDHFARGAWKQGRRALLDHPTRAALLSAALLLTGLFWVRSAGPGARRHSELTSAHRSPGPALMLVGLTIFLAAWAPLALIHYPSSPRLAYAPSIGLAIALAGLLDLLLTKLPRRPLASIITRAVALPILLAGAVMMIGIQDAYRTRWQADQQQGETLRRLIPAPPDSPRPVFIPIRVADHPIRTGSHNFDNHFLSPLFSEWAAGWWLELHYRRNDVLTVQGLHAQTDSPSAGNPTSAITWLNSTQVETRQRLAPPARKRLHLFDISQIIPFEVTERGEILLYTHLALDNSPDAPSPIPLPMTAEALAQDKLPARTLHLPRGTPTKTAP